MKTLLCVIYGALIGAVAIGGLAFLFNVQGGSGDGLTREFNAMFAPMIGLYFAVIGLVPGAILGGIYGIVRARRETPARNHSDRKP
jgi:hypothetical protein